MTYSRSFHVDRAHVNAETGEFRAVLFSDGEATDGHILNIRGGKVPDQMPLFVNHNADPREQLGSLFFDRKTQHEVHVRGQIFLDGDGPQREIRRDIMAKIAAGHVSRMSGRWDAGPESVKRRVDLPKDHPHHVPEGSKGNKRFGLYFERWDALEGSVVGLGADPAAVMRWSQDESLSEEVRHFYRSLLANPDAEIPEESPRSLDCETESEDSKRDVEVEEVEKHDEPKTDIDRVEAFLTSTQAAIEAGIPYEELLERMAEKKPAEPESDSDLRQEVIELRKRVAELEEKGRVSASPSEATWNSSAEFLREVNLEFKRSREEHRRQVRALIDAKKGEILDRDKRDAVAEIRARLEEYARHGRIPDRG